MTLADRWPPSDAPPAGAPAGGPSLTPPGATRIFGRAVRMAVRREPVQSLAVPFLLFLPWSVLDEVLPDMRWGETEPSMVALWAASALGSLITMLIVSAMLRVRLAAAITGQKQGALDAYARALERVPALFFTEIVRTVAVSAATVFFIVPGIILSYRLSVATEAVVLTEPHMAGAFQRSFSLTAGRFSSWLSMLLVTILTWVAVLVPASTIYVLLSMAWPDIPASLVVAPCLPLLLAVVQYAWTLYFMELRARTVKPAVVPGAPPETTPATAGGAPPGEAQSSNEPLTG